MPFGKLPVTTASTAKKRSIPPVEIAPPTSGHRQATTSPHAGGEEEGHLDRLDLPQLERVDAALANEHHEDKNDQDGGKQPGRPTQACFQA
jgi:hypothetical protein